MNRILASLFLALFLNLNGFSQVNETAWNSEKVAVGIVWKSFHFDDLFESRQYLSILEVDLDERSIQVDLAYSRDSLLGTDVLAQRKDALAAVNATFFNMKNGGSTKYLKVDGSVINEIHGPDGKDFAGEGALVVGLDKNVEIIQRFNWWDDEVVQGYEDLIAAGPLLIFNSKVLLFEQDAFHLNRHPRTAVGITGDNKLIMITADGRTSESEGLSIPELASVMKELGCVRALNLDGGGSTTMWIQGKGIVNHPSDNGIFDHLGTRPVANAVIIVPR